jgi:DNA-binding MarR family transcriptional regulator
MYHGAVEEDSELGNELLRAVARLNRWASRHAAVEVPMAQARLLALLDELGPARVSVLAAADNCSQPTMTTQLQRLEAEGWAQRVPDADDARATLVSLTADGGAALRQARGARVAVLSPVFDRLDDVDLQRLRTAVTAIEDLLDHAAQTPAPPSRKEA